MEEIQRRYNLTVNNEEMSSEDKRLVLAIQNLKANYKTELDKRKCTVMIEPSQIKQLPSIIVSTSRSKNKENKKENKNEKKEIQLTCTCQAVKMDGSSCTAKAKFGNYCGRHKEKSS